MDTLKGKVAIVTGASRGLGEAISSLFASEGARVVLSSRSGKVVDRIANRLREQGMDAIAKPCDVRDLKQVEKLARFALERYGGFDIWVNNAGAPGPYGATLDLTPADFMTVMNTNILGVYHGSRTAMRHFVPRHSGKLINILGAGERKPVPNQNAYGSSKAWIRMFTLALASEYRKSGVGVFLLQPGLMDTDLLSHIITYPDYEERLRNFMPLLIRAAAKKPASPAARALWLASQATDGKTGLEVRAGSSLTFLLGFMREGFRRVFKSTGREIPLQLEVVPSAFTPLPGESRGSQKTSKMKHEK